MTTLFDAMNTGNVTTTNGMAANETTTSHCVDLFFKAGASRGKDIIPQFTKAFAENQEIAIRIMLNVRDVRGGAGERQLFRDVLVHLANSDADLAIRVATKVPELGRWDDLLVLLGTPVEETALDLIKNGLIAEDGLCAKWMPRPNGSKKNKLAANKIRKHLGMTPKQYRSLLSTLTNVVETAMCAKEWTAIDFAKIPSVAAARYQRAFDKNAPEAYQAYRDALTKGETTINAGAVYPYDVIQSLRTGKADVANAQWKALPDYCDGSEERLLSVVDVSGSMGCPAGGYRSNSSVTCMDVAISLGLYTAERMRGPFQDQFITFSSRPQMQKVTGTLEQRYNQMLRADWGMNTSLEAVFTLLLDKAVEFGVQEDQMPTTLVIYSDMQFDRCIDEGRGRTNSTAMQMIKDKYAAAGFTLPKVVFWNINAHDNVPVGKGAENTALVSGFSPAILKTLLSGVSYTPYDIMMEAISNERYNF